MLIQSPFLLLVILTGMASGFVVKDIGDPIAIMERKRSNKGTLPSQVDTLGNQIFEFGARRSLLEVALQVDTSLSMPLKPVSPTSLQGTGVPSQTPTITSTPTVTAQPTTFALGMPSAVPPITATDAPALNDGAPVFPSVAPSQTTFAPAAAPSLTNTVPVSIAPVSIAPVSIAPVSIAPASIAPASTTASPIAPTPPTHPTLAPLSPVVTGSPETLLPTAFDVTEVTGIFSCTDQGIFVAGTSGGPTTEIILSVAYAAEIDGPVTSDIERAIEAALLEAAIAAALGCGVATNDRRVLQLESRRLKTFTDTLGPCIATVDEASCFVMESDLSFTVNKEVDPRYAAYLSYLAIRDGMTNSTFADNIDSVYLLSYLAPLPLVAPSNSTQPLDTIDDSRRASNGNKTKSWMIAACVIMSAGGLVALVAWFYSCRQQGSKQNVEIRPSVSSSSEVSLFSAEAEVEDA